MKELTITGSTNFSRVKEADEDGVVITIKGEFDGRMSNDDLRTKVDIDAHRLAEALKETLPHVTLSRLAQRLVEHVTTDSLTRHVI